MRVCAVLGARPLAPQPRAARHRSPLDGAPLAMLQGARCFGNGTCARTQLLSSEAPPVIEHVRETGVCYATLGARPRALAVGVGRRPGPGARRGASPSRGWARGRGDHEEAGLIAMRPRLDALAMCMAALHAPCDAPFQHFRWSFCSRKHRSHNTSVRLLTKCAGNYRRTPHIVGGMGF